MKPYRFSPIKNERELRNAIRYIHIACHTLLRQSYNSYLPVCGNIGIFCHYDQEYEFLTNLRKKLTDESQSILKKYYLLHTPIIIPAADDIPETVYTHLYIRKPDDYHPQVGDVDFYLPSDQYQKYKRTFPDGKFHNFARIFPRGDLDMIEILNPSIDAATYIRSDEEITRLT